MSPAPPPPATSNGHGNAGPDMRTIVDRSPVAPASTSATVTQLHKKIKADAAISWFGEVREHLIVHPVIGVLAYYSLRNLYASLGASAAFPLGSFLTLVVCLYVADQVAPVPWCKRIAHIAIGFYGAPFIVKFISQVTGLTIR